MLRQAWREELDSHVLDCADELVQLGYDPAAAIEEAKKQLGDVDQIAKELATVHPLLAVYADWIAFSVLVLSIVPIYIVQYFSASTLLGLISEQLILWWYGCGLVLIALLLVNWQWSIIPVTQRRSIAVALSMGWFIATCITVALDINNFETIIYNGLFALSCGLIILALWKPLALWHRQLFLLVVVSLMIAFAWREEGLWERDLFQQCLYLIDSNPLVNPSSFCSQVTPLSGYFLLIYAFTATAITFLTHYLVRLWNNGSQLYRKVITTGALVCLPLGSFSMTGVNNNGALDVVAWKVDIYQAYDDILGRRPEAKDYEFYGTTRSYEHMSKVRSVLYASPERREKIRLEFIKILSREPTTEELNDYSSGTQTINQITKKLEQMN